MEPSFSIISNAMKRAGLTPTEMIFLLPIGRATFYNWKRGQPITDLLRYRLCEARCKVIQRAVEMEKLPLSEDTPRRQRLPNVKRILDEVRTGR